VKQFREILVGRKAAEFDEWMDRAFASGPREVRNFVVALRKDLGAVRAAVTHEWSTGPVEGQINRLKLLKRQLYGRAKIDLLRIRLPGGVIPTRPGTSRSSKDRKSRTKVSGRFWWQTVLHWGRVQS
jgi:hypothetical protein